MRNYMGDQRLVVLGLLACFIFFSVHAEARVSFRKKRVFLQKELPLTIVVTTPTELAGNGTAATSVFGRQALTVVFSRPVIALGSDFGTPSAVQKLPFSLTCDVPGKSRWVTTTIARFDPDVDWPSDLDCELVWAKNLTTYDGAPLFLGDIAERRRLSTTSLSMWVDGVTSELATNLTDGLWSSNQDGQYEVPPDGKILLRFGYPVNLLRLQSSLQIFEGVQARGPQLGFDVGPCMSRAPWLYWPAWGASASSASTSSSAADLSLDVNTRCAEIAPKFQLKPATNYTLVLPAGARYHALAGPLQRAASVRVLGLRPFQIDFLNTFSNSADGGTRYRRLDLHLLHGLSSDTSPAALAARISLCSVSGRSGCNADVPFTLTMVSRGKARLTVPTLTPRVLYKISVAADSRVKDGFGQGLLGSELTYWSSSINYAFAPPRPSTSVAILEAGVDSLRAWPFVTRGVGSSSYPGDYPAAVSSWELDLTSDKVKALVARTVQQDMYINSDLVSLYGQPTATLNVPPELLSTEAGAPDWTELQLPLSDGAKASRARLVAYTGRKNPQLTLYSKLLLNTSLSLNVIQAGQNLTAWVLDAAVGGGPVAGAAVSVFVSPPVWVQASAEVVATCVTDATGLCTMTHSKANDWTLTAFAAAGDQFAVLHNVGIARAATQPATFVASLLSDRLVVVPGDTVKITGFVQRATPTGLQLPPASYAALQVNPSWKASAAAGVGTAAGGVTKPGRGLLQSGPEVVAYDTTTLDTSSAVVARSVAAVAEFVVQPGGMPMGADAPAAPATYPVKINGTTGTFHAEIQVPSDARLQPYTLQLLVPKPGTASADPSGPEPAAGSSELSTWPVASSSSITITVADPRPPTADLKLVAPPWVYPTAVVRFNATAVSYIGAAVGGAALTVTWRTANASDVMELTTDDTGVAVGEIDLGALPPANRSTAYDDLSIDVEWIGPTRERITRSANVILADGPARLSVSLSLTPSIPGTAFAISATLTSNTDGSPLTGLPVTATLRPAPNDTTAGAVCSTATACTVSSGAGFSRDCQLALPCVGKFQLEACAEVTLGSGGSQRVCSRRVLGRNTSEWSDKPLRAHPEPQLLSDKTSYAIGDVVKLQLQNPWPGARLLLQWGNEFKSRTKIVDTLSSGLAEVTIGPLGDESVGGGSIVAVLDVPRLTAGQLPALPPPGQLAISRLFDPLAPHTHILRTGLVVRNDNALTVSVEVADAGGSGGSSWTIQDVNGDEVLAVEPGAQAEVTVTVGNADTALTPGSPVEVTVYAVDKAFLDLLPYDLPQPQQQMVLRLAADIRACGVSAYRVAPGAVRAVYDKLMARLTGLDPWLPLDTSLALNDWNAVDTNDTTYLGRYSTTLTRGTVTWYYPEQYGMYDTSNGLSMATESLGVGAAVATVPSDTSKRGDGIGSMAAADGSAGGAGSSSSSSTAAAAVTVRSESDFVVTPLFTTATTDSAGRASVSFKAPQNLGTFVLRAFAAAGSTARYGSGESKVAVRRRLSLTPSVPRFVRVGDTFQAGVVVTVGSAPASVTVTLKLAGSSAAAPLKLTGRSSKTVSFRVGEDLQQEVRFAFSADAIGSANLTFTAVDGQAGGGEDALQLEIPVTGQQGDVWVATSFALTALPESSSSSVVQWQEGMELPKAVPGSGGLNLTAGVGYFPAIATTYDNLLQSEADRTYASAVSALLWATLPAVLSYYGQPISSPQTNASARGFTELSTLTLADIGLQWSDPTRWYGWQPTRTDLYLNTWALFLSALHGPALRSPASPLPPSLASFAASWASLESGQLPVWRTAVGRQIVADAVEARTRQYFPGPYSDWNTLAWVRLVLGADWTPTASDQIKQDLSLATLVSNTQKLDRQVRVLVSLVLQTMGSANPHPQLVTTTINDVTSALRVQGRTAYVAFAPGAASASSLEDQALSLLLLLRAGVTHQLLPKLAAYVANPAQTGTFGVFSFPTSGRDQGLAVAALSEYDRVRGSSKPDVELTADVNGLTVLEAAFKPGGSTSPVSNTTAWETLPEAPAGGLSELNFEVTGSGEVTVAASLHFVPATLLSFPTYRGLFVESALQLVDPATGRPTGQRLAAVPLGSVVALTVQLTSPDDLGPVTLSVMMPGGLEPLDPNLAAGGPGGSGGLGLSCGANWVQDVWTSFFRWWWWPMCPSQETRPSVVTFSYLGLRAGTSSVTVTAVAATAGTFVVPPIRAFADSQPELMGMTAAGKIVVCDDCTGPTYAGPVPVPKACMNDCSGNGMCNLKTGTCRCDAGYTRADCSRLIR